MYLDLKPRFFVLTSNRQARQRLLAYGVDAIKDYAGMYAGKTKKELFKLLVEKKIIPSSSRSFSNNELSKVVGESAGKGGEGSDLLVCLGNDPASTLQAIMAHRPESCYLAYDKDSGYVRELAGRLCSMSGELPVDRLIPVQTDLLGRNLRTGVPGVQLTQEIDVNVSPGTKAQCWNLTMGRDKSSVFTLNNRNSCSQSLDSSRSCPYAAIPVIIQARACGGPVLEDKAVFLEDFLKDEEWCRAMLRCVLQAAGSQRNKEKRVSLNQLDTRRVKHQLLNSDRIMIQVSDGDQTFEKICSGKTLQDGFWLEPVVAYGFLQAGREKIIDMMLNIAWSWDAVQGKGETFHGELDAVINRGGNFLGVSCKQGYSGHEDPVSAYEQAKTDVIGVSKFGLGRFAVPVLVGPKVPGAARESGEERLLELNLGDFASPESLAEKIDNHIQSLRNFSA